MKTPLSWLLRGVIAIVLLQTLFFKFTGAEESIYIFSTLGVEPWGRYASGIVELVAALLVLIPSTAALGALLAAATMGGAIASHGLWLGLEVRGDGGLLFGLALTVLLGSLGTLVLHHAELFALAARLRPAPSAR